MKEKDKAIEKEVSRIQQESGYTISIRTARRMAKKLLK